MIPNDLGKLERVDLRAVWRDEADDFTPWLALQENLDTLGDTLGMQIEFQAREKAVGPYSADILCRDVDDDRYVVIENQLETTDHDHLGKLLTYAAHFNASTVVWVAQAFTDQHRAAVDWLNDTSAEGTRFFALEIEVWRIGESAYAPKFNMVAKPNNWTKGGQAHAASLSETGQVQLDFWKGFYDHVEQHGQQIRLTSTPQGRNRMNAGGIGRPGFRLCAIASTYSETMGWKGQELRAELIIRHRELSAQYHDLLLSQKAEIEQEMGGELSWPTPGDSTTCKIYSRKDVDLYDPDARNEQYTWLLEQLESLYRVFAGRIQELEPRS